MSESSKTTLVLAHLAGLALSIGAVVALTRTFKDSSIVVLVGDVGGTNIRLSLRRLCLKTRTSEEIIPLTKIASQSVPSFEAAVT